MSTNGQKPLSMRINPGYDRDPLKPRKFRVVDEGGFIVHTSEEPIEMLKLAAAAQHAVNRPNESLTIVDEQQTVVESFGSYYVEPSEDPPGPERLKLRDRWLDNVMRFLLPPGLYARKDDPDSGPRLAHWFRKHKIEISIRPDGGAVVVFRDGNPLTQWGC